MTNIPKDSMKQQVGRLVIFFSFFMAALAVVGLFAVSEENGFAQGIGMFATFAIMAGLLAFVGRKLLRSWRTEDAARQAIAARYAELTREKGVVDLTTIAREQGVDQGSVKRAVAWARWRGMLPVRTPSGVRVEHTGKVQRGGDLYGLFVITLGIYTFFWIHRVITELHRHNPGGVKISPGRAAGLCFVPGFNLYWLPYLYAFVTREVNANYRRFDDAADLMAPSVPVTAFVVLNLIPLASLVLFPLAIVLAPIPMTLVQGVLNRYWLICQAAHQREPATTV